MFLCFKYLTHYYSPRLNAEDVALTPNSGVYKEF